MSIRLGNNIIAGSYAVVQNAVYTKDETNKLLDNKANKEDLADIATTGEYNDIINKPPHIENSHNDGSIKYCVWSDGKIEQWGIATNKNIEFYLPYTDTNYTFTVSIQLGDTEITNISDLCYAEKTNSGVVWSTEIGTTIKSIDWYACGY